VVGNKPLVCGVEVLAGSCLVEFAHPCWSNPDVTSHTGLSEEFRDTFPNCALLELLAFGVYE